MRREPTIAHSHAVCRVLVVEDDPAIASLIVDALEGEIGVKATTLGDGEDAIRFLAQQRVNLVVLDYQLPSANGIQVCDAIQRFPHMRDVPLLFVTANAESADFQSRHLRYIRKPFDLMQFLDTVKQCLQEQQACHPTVMRL